MTGPPLNALGVSAIVTERDVLEVRGFWGSAQDDAPQCILTLDIPILSNGHLKTSCKPNILATSIAVQGKPLAVKVPINEVEVTKLNLRLAFGGQSLNSFLLCVAVTKPHVEMTLGMPPNAISVELPKSI